MLPLLVAPHATLLWGKGINTGEFLIASGEFVKAMQALLPETMLSEGKRRVQHTPIVPSRR
jgi:hypothetical protein